MSDETVTLDQWTVCPVAAESSREELAIDLGRLGIGIRMFHRRCGYEVLFPNRSSVEWPDLVAQAARHLPPAVVASGRDVGAEGAG